MKFSLTLAVAATACLLALSNAATLGVRGRTTQFYSSNDRSCHRVTNDDNSRQVSVQVRGQPGVNLYSDSDCKREITSVRDNGNNWRPVQGPVKGFRVMDH
ncbi:hypothetical protein IWW38_005876 [Coemansia aciculifera]|uniref:Uncharacterized protein n=1 Tax=Coemansia aciculifera TaxID=417176 RepID=A0ACC1LUE5_9FUNG|nr:hypothetical protein IWW38_005876 [Coemansia aciculifera]